MKKILIFGGTTEGRIIALTLAKNSLQVHLRVATEYGQQVLEKAENLSVITGRLSPEEMVSLQKKENYDLVIDATHPYAKEVSTNIQEAFSSKFNDAVKVLRFERNAEGVSGSQFRYFNSAEECVEELKKTTGKVLLTTGSKELKKFTDDTVLKERIIARVLPGIESISLCKEAGLEGKQIIAMQGPFSKDMNKAIINEYGISVLVTKESGRNGGEGGKLNAAEECGINCFIIKKPSVEYGRVCRDFNSLYSEIENILEIKICFRGGINITVAGTGPGSDEYMTLGTVSAIMNADYVFGAERMIRNVKTLGEKIPLYRADDVKEKILSLKNERGGQFSVAVLYSGDTGFYSGAEKICGALSLIPDTEITVNPGISSVQYMAAKTGVSWQNASFVSTHGVNEEEWKCKLEECFLNAGRIFVITSGREDVVLIAEKVRDFNKKQSVFRFSMKAGYMLSYDEEEIFNVNVESEVPPVDFLKPGLYTLLLKRSQYEK